MPNFTRRSLIALSAASLASGCTTLTDVTRQGPIYVEGYEPIDDEYFIPAVPEEYLAFPNRRQLIFYEGTRAPGDIEVDIHGKFLYWILEDGTAWRYPIAVGRAGLSLSGTTSIQRKEEWPSWTPTANMIRREPEIYGPFRNGVEGGPASPLGARALYLYRGGRDTFYRIHGTNDLASIGNSGSAGCIRMFNQDVIDLYDRVPLGTTVYSRTYEESVRILGVEVANRGVELPSVQVSPETIYGATEIDPLA